MAVLSRIAYYQNRKDEVPNQELAHDLANREDRLGILEIAENLWNPKPEVQSDCLKVLYEIGYLKPELVSDYAGDFMQLLHSQNNRLVWEAMIALFTIASLRADMLYTHLGEITRAVDSGSVITRDNGVKVLAAIAAQNQQYCLTICPYLLHHLQNCRPKDVPQHAESILPAVDASNRDTFIRILEQRMVDLSGAQIVRVKKVVKTAQGIGLSK
jgi:hypothetical protein